MIAMMILGMLSCSYSFMPLYSIQRLASFALLWVTLFGGAWTWLQSYRNVLLGTHLVFVLICVVSFLSLVHLGQEGLVERTIRAKGAFGRPTGAGGFAGVAIPIVLWKIRYSRGLVLWIALLVLATQGYVLLFSGARGAIIASAISLPIMAWRLYRSSRGVIVILLLVTGSGIAGGFLGLSNLPDYVVRRDTIEGLSGRTSRYEVAWHLIKKRPLLGWGFGVARYATSMDREALAILSGEGTFSESSAYMEKQLASGTPVAVALHSEQLERLVETGILGGLCFILFWGLLTRDIWLALVGPQNSASELVVALAASCWFLFLNTFLHAELFAIGMGTTTCYWFIIVLTIAGSRHHQSMSHGRVA
ncbi:MAG: O-antigen ligase family protein [Candidatus Nealsonbacteria bacterium]|nr:O-antigen ligase family protein [Candidatus Nealsonbacteria bacterium]